ncbi:segregation and condensation protein B [Thiogranum longum]|uniref:Segregation and condensation protein B n=1 Tax=Thiogranum longum TaxID=1537524 RepID=A0A4R1H975_9GAMM|nr:SMC-Scp complex subunit ScpB [Thiogranum longum]TCK17818.1 segregation and condensation protein B [Thiogranum longum]
MSESDTRIKYIVESVLLASGKPLTLDNILAVFGDGEKPERDQIRDAITALQEDYAERGIELVQVGSGYRIQVGQDMEPWVSRLTEEKPQRYTRALLETLALVAYRQPITRGEIEDIRGVSVSSSIMKTLQDREWVRVVGHRDVPGRPAMYGTTKKFLDYFNLKGLDDLPTLMELRDFDSINAELELAMPGEAAPDLTIVDNEDAAVETEAEETASDDTGLQADDESATVVQVAVDTQDPPGTIH